MQKSANRAQFFTNYASKGARFLQKVTRLSAVFNVFFRGVSTLRPLPWVTCVTAKSPRSRLASWSRYAGIGRCVVGETRVVEIAMSAKDGFLAITGEVGGCKCAGADSNRAEQVRRKYFNARDASGASAVGTLGEEKTP